MGKSVADGKNLIGSVVGGNSNSSFATLANNAKAIKNERDSYANRVNGGIKALVGSINNYQIAYIYSFTYVSGTDYNTSCGKDSTSYYYDITLSSRFDLSKVKLIIRMTGQVDYYNGVGSSGGTIRNGTTVPKGYLYNNSSGNTILRLYQNYSETGVSVGTGSWSYYYTRYVEYNILYL